MSFTILHLVSATPAGPFGLFAIFCRLAAVALRLGAAQGSLYHRISAPHAGLDLYRAECAIALARPALHAPILINDASLAIIHLKDAVRTNHRA
jgi:hypothetical protein